MGWFESNCDEDWEHSYGIKIYTLDNPGWTIEIDLAETRLSNVVFSTTTIDRSESDWIYCTVTDGVFRGAGGINNLDELIEIFLNWAEGF